MKLHQIVFSPTGGTQKAADALARAWNGETEQIDLTREPEKEFSFAAEDTVLIAVPSYGGRVPAPAARRLAFFRGSQTPCILVCVYGNRAYEDTLAELQDLAEKQGFCTAAAVAAVAEHSILHQYAAGRPDAEDIQALQDFGAKIYRRIKSGPRQETLLSLPGNRPYKAYGGVGMIPKANKNCTKCGICSENCPAQAISPADLKTADQKKCISCMRCVVQCPASARNVSAVMLSAASLALKKACSGRKENELFLPS